MARPDFLGIGALKAGTTLLHSLLDQHPDVCLSRHVKEVKYFDVNYARGESWYESMFHGCGSAVKGEVSPGYIYNEPCAERIAAYVPDVRLILLARDPVERAFSQYKHWVKETGYHGRFEAFAAEHPNCVDRGFYHRQLTRYLDRFPRDQIDVVLFEDLVGDPQSVMEGVFGFIGVDPSVQVTAGGPVNASEIPRHHRLYTVARKGAMWAYSNDHAWMVSWAKRLGASRPLVSADREASFEPMSAETRARLAAGYEDDVVALGALIGRDLSAVWRSAAGAGAPASGG